MLKSEIISTSEVGENEYIVILKVSLKQSLHEELDEIVSSIDSNLSKAVASKVGRSKRAKPKAKTRRKKAAVQSIGGMQVTSGDKISAARVYGNVKSHLEKGDRTAAHAAISRLIDKHGKAKFAKLFDPTNFGKDACDLVNDFLVDEGLIS